MQPEALTNPTAAGILRTERGRDAGSLFRHRNKGPLAAALSMAAEAGLIVLAIVRRLLLEMGHELTPEEINQPDQNTGRLERWIHEPRAELEGKTLVHAYAASGDEQVLRCAVAELVGKSRPPAAEGAS
ncbi:hypothetical protein [Methylibium petroleiphilum]|uniref:hypothetical protein n=1 Tax=Methylibium petroleiphilum TaxID=105560 RepID=UPI0011D16707|nr:hypothetical protein [Methylibium petroleiphilum]